MSLPSKLNSKQKDLIRRYLVWCYKTTKEDLDRIDRYFTQEIADDFLLKELKKSKHHKRNAAFRDLTAKFEQYKTIKREKAGGQKYRDESKGLLNPQYQYLSQRFLAVEKAVRHFLGPRELKKIRELYEEEMTSRILHARDHR